MSRPIFKLFAMILSAFAVSAAQAGGPSGALHSTRPQPVILSTQVDSAQHRLFIAGAHFGQRPLAVTLGGHALSVLDASSTEIIASLPADLPSSTYLLRISRADDITKAGTFSLPVHVAEAELR